MKYPLKCATSRTPGYTTQWIFQLVISVDLKELFSHIRMTSMLYGSTAYDAALDRPHLTMYIAEITVILRQDSE